MLAVVSNNIKFRTRNLHRRNVCVIRTIIIYRRIIFKFFSLQRNCKFHSFWFLLGIHFQIVLSIFIHLTFTVISSSKSIVLYHYYLSFSSHEEQNNEFEQSL